jgi:hypothetical protein
MDETTIDKILKPYWDDIFNKLYIIKTYGGNLFITSFEDSEGNPVVEEFIDLDRTTEWFYDTDFFGFDRCFFGIGLTEYNESMKRYLNERYDLEIDSIS